MPFTMAICSPSRRRLSSCRIRRVQRLKGMQQAHFESMLEAKWDEDFMSRDGARWARCMPKSASSPNGFWGHSTSMPNIVSVDSPKPKGIH